MIPTKNIYFKNNFKLYFNDLVKIYENLIDQ